jgi:hypothetical protein
MMSKKRGFTLFLAIIAVAFMAQVAFAANQVNVTMNKKIVPKTACEQAGSVALNLDNQTVMHIGDQINLLLNNGAEVCGTMDYYLMLTNNAGPIGDDPINPVRTSNGGADRFTILYNGAPMPFGPFVVTEADLVTTTTNELGLRIVVNTNQKSMVYLTLGRRITATTNIADYPVGKFISNSAENIDLRFDAASTDSLLIIQFFDRNHSVLSATNYFYEKPKDSVLYTNDLKAVDGSDDKDNVLCLNLLKVTQSLVQAIPESVPLNSNYQLQYVGDFIIAQILGNVSYNVGPACKDATCLEVSLTAGLDQEGNNTPADGLFDFGNYGVCSSKTEDRWTSVGYCTASSRGSLNGNGILFYQSVNFSQNDEYEIKITLKDSSADGANSEYAYFTATAPNDVFMVPGQKTSTGLNCSSCGAAGLAAVTDGPQTQTWSSNDPATPTVLTGKITIGSEEISLGGILIDLPGVQLNLKKVSDGDKITATVVVSKLPCGQIATATVCLAELVGICTPMPASRQLLFPFVTPFDVTDADPFWTGIAISNVSMKPIKVTLKFYDTAGGTGTYVEDLASQGMLRTTVGDIKDKLNAGSTLDTTKYSYMEAYSDLAFSIDGIIFVGDTGLNIVHGYLGRP